MKLSRCRAWGLAAALSGFAYIGQTGVSFADPSPCDFPTAPSASNEETAWRLFVAANCPGAHGPGLTWETWIEQLQLYPATGTAAAMSAGPIKRLHGSPLARVVSSRSLKALLAPNTQCNPMGGPPPNVTSGATVCEEVHVSPDAAAFLTGNHYQTRPAQTAAANSGADIQFPKTSVEVKVDWIPATDFNPPFTCTTPPSGLHVEVIDGTCYAMAGMHIASKLLNNWLWATFEPQSMLTNPLRCIAFGPCNDPWGSNPAASNGGASGFTQLMPALKTLMTQAKLAPEFLNYRLDGAQINFTNADNTPTYLGNSIIEGENVGMKKDTASCITCHSFSSIKNDGTDGLNALFNASTTVGPEYKVPANWVARDFVWSMGLACPDPTKTGEQACH
jgi:hypothetical protein